MTEDSQTPATASSGSPDGEWVRPPTHTSEVYVNVPKGVELTPKVTEALDDFLKALHQDPVGSGPDIEAEATCLKISIEPCAWLVHCQIGGPID